MFNRTYNLFKLAVSCVIVYGVLPYLCYLVTLVRVCVY